MLATRVGHYKVTIWWKKGAKSCLGPRAPPKSRGWEKAAKQHPVTIYKDYEASLHRLRKDFKENCALQNPKLNQCSLSCLRRPNGQVARHWGMRAALSGCRRSVRPSSRSSSRSTVRFEVYTYCTYSNLLYDTNLVRSNCSPVLFVFVAKRRFRSPASLYRLSR
jgi:hypothetical protein